MPSGLVLLPSNVPGESYSNTFTKFMSWAIIIIIMVENNGLIDRYGAW